ncbi:MAG TPA: MFS transporter [Gemmatimonadaceae bacterium]|nr:MFS transporter [Gemmatimonadaceae bacterium]
MASSAHTAAIARPAELPGRPESVTLGLRANWSQFALLVVVNAFVGAMVGLERSVLPIIATTEFRVGSTTAALAFIASFGLAKAFTNLASGWLADRRARRSILLSGWLFALPVPLLILWARDWSWIVAANLFLGVNQGLAWSMTIVMKMDLVGPRRRGLAMGFNEFAGYVALGTAGIMSGFAAAHYGLRAGTAYPGLAIALAGMLLSWFVRDTARHVRLESSQHTGAATTQQSPRLRAILGRSLWSDRGLFSVSQAGLVNNLNDGLAWGVFPLLFTASGLSLRETSILAAVYPVTWGFLQLATGPLSDRWGRKPPIVAGMVLQGAALIDMAVVHGFAPWAGALVALGVGTALVYPALIAAVGDIAHPSWRGAAVGVYRLWRDLGYVVGALLAGVLSDLFGSSTAIGIVGVLTAASGLVVAIRFEARTVHPIVGAFEA